MSTSDFDDFFDSPKRPSNPRPTKVIKGSSSDDGSKLDTDRNSSTLNSAISSAKSGVSIKIEARVPSFADQLRSDSDSDSDPMNCSYQSHKPPRPKSSVQSDHGDRRKQSSAYDKKSSNTDNKYFKQTAWDDSSNKPQRRMAASLADAKPGDNYISSATGKKMRKGRCHYSDTESDSNSDANYSDRTAANARHSKYRRRSSESESESPRSRSTSNSSEWSTGSESSRSKIPHTPRTPRERHFHRGNHTNRAGSRSHSDDTLSISSLSGSEIDTARPASRSAPVQPAKSRPREAEDDDKMNLHRLLAALLESEHEQQQPGPSSRHISSSNKNSDSNNKMNYTFSSDKARMIDMENQRLLQNILSQRSEGNAIPVTSKAQQQTKQKSNIRVTEPMREPPRVTHATLNRMRERQRVERENLALLRRLHQIKPSEELSRKKQLESYNRQMSYHCPQMRTTNPGIRSQSAQGLSSTSSSAGGRSRPSSASRAYRPASATNSRPSSGYSTASAVQRKPRPSSAKTRPKPDWETGW